ncbi:MAG: RNA polymerase sigma factor [Bryobacteraceae bacterium]
MVDPDTGIGGAASRFPQTHRSAILRARSDDAAERAIAFEAIVAAYWKPVYKHIRLKWRRSNEDAKDLTQGFFSRAIEKNFFAGYDPAKASFRTFLRVCLDGYVSNEDRAARRLKRAGDTPPRALDFEDAEGELQHIEISDGTSLEDVFQREWVRSVFGLAVDRLREECAARGREVHFRLFERYDLDDSPVSYQQLAAEFGLTATTVTNYLALARRELRRIILDLVRELTGDEREFESEARFLLGFESRRAG